MTELLKREERRTKKEESNGFSVLCHARRSLPSAFFSPHSSEGWLAR
jgi:hypothetical protein